MPQSNPSQVDRMESGAMQQERAPQQVETLSRLFFFAFSPNANADDEVTFTVTRGQLKDFFQSIMMTAGLELVWRYTVELGFSAYLITDVATNEVLVFSPEAENLLQTATGESIAHRNELSILNNILNVDQIMAQAQSGMKVTTKLEAPYEGWEVTNRIISTGTGQFLVTIFYNPLQRELTYAQRSLQGLETQFQTVLENVHTPVLVIEPESEAQFCLRYANLEA